MNTKQVHLLIAKCYKAFSWLWKM